MLIAGVTTEPFGTVHEDEFTVWFTPGPLIVQEVLIAVALQAMVAVPLAFTRFGVAVIVALRVPGQIETFTTGHVAAADAPCAETVIWYVPTELKVRFAVALLPKGPPPCGELHEYGAPALPDVEVV